VTETSGLMNLMSSFYLAQGTGARPPADFYKTAGRPGGFFTGETILILGLVLLLGAAAFAWALFLRKRRPHDSRRRVIEAGSTADDGAPVQGEHRHHRHGQRRRRHRSSRHTHRNPTLQETGGLPAPRPEDQPPAF